ncbi:MAG: type II toxin-antitoxin system RelE/ParE family toxin [Paracoccaceae bacterium]
MNYNLEFLPSATKEWRKLGATVRAQFVKKLTERLENPRVPASKLSGSTDRYKIKLRKSGYRLIYEVVDGRLVIMVIAIGKRNRDEAYEKAADR